MRASDRTSTGQSEASKPGIPLVRTWSLASTRIPSIGRSPNTPAHERRGVQQGGGLQYFGVQGRGELPGRRFKGLPRCCQMQGSWLISKFEAHQPTFYAQHNSFFS